MSDAVFYFYEINLKSQSKTNTQTATNKNESGTIHTSARTCSDMFTDFLFGMVSEFEGK